MKIREFKLINVDARKNVDLRYYEERIVSCYLQINPNLKVIVESDAYYVIGDITNFQLRMAGKMIARRNPLAKYCKRYGTSTQLFKCFSIDEI